MIYMLHFVDLISYGKIAFLLYMTKHVKLNLRRALKEGLKRQYCFFRQTSATTIVENTDEL